MGPRRRSLPDPWRVSGSGTPTPAGCLVPGEDLVAWASYLALLDAKLRDAARVPSEVAMSALVLHVNITLALSGDIPAGLIPRARWWCRRRRGSRRCVFRRLALDLVLAGPPGPEWVPADARSAPDVGRTYEVTGSSWRPNRVLSCLQGSRSAGTATR